MPEGASADVAWATPSLRATGPSERLEGRMPEGASADVAWATPCLRDRRSQRSIPLKSAGIPAVARRGAEPMIKW
jgi:hypothetical protein